MQVLEITADLICKSDREHPADAVLRAELGARRDLSAALKSEVSRTVFAYFRWRGWLDLQRPFAEQVRHALELAEAFAVRPRTFSDGKLIERSLAAWVRDTMDVRASWVRSIQREPVLYLRAGPGQGTLLAGKLKAARKSPIPDALIYEGKEDLIRTAEFHAGEFELQDISSQAVGLICDPKAGETWWDVCAGEGGKTLHLADLMKNKGLIWATDRAAWRLQRLRRRAARAGVFNYRARIWDGGPKLPTATKFDGALVDAPCSGIGTWQRNPHARWTTTPQDVQELSEIQKRLLVSTAPSVKPGGRLIYCVCTLTRRETGEVADAFEEQFPDFQPWVVANPFKPHEHAARIWLWPQDTGGNGMFVAAWKRGARAGTSA
jgi:16S rRNA (cytosine967-C5)-methyltransferase